MDYNSITLLKNLFDKCQKDGDESSSDSENEREEAFGPGDIKQPKKSQIVKTLDNPLLKKVNVDNSIKSMEDFEKQQMNDEELLDTRKHPEYKITYKQAVTTEDIYLQMGLKTPATSSCEDMIVEVKIPDETVGIDQMDLTVEEDKIELKTPIYRLKLMLPHKVNPQKGRAEYDKERKILKLTVKMNREYDFVNF
jgi:hypothetical protein